MDARRQHVSAMAQGGEAIREYRALRVAEEAMETAEQRKAEAMSRVSQTRIMFAEIGVLLVMVFALLFFKVRGCAWVCAGGCGRGRGWARAWVGAGGRGRACAAAVALPHRTRCTDSTRTLARAPRAGRPQARVHGRRQLPQQRLCLVPYRGHLHEPGGQLGRAGLRPAADGQRALAACGFACCVCACAGAHDA